VAFLKALIWWVVKIPVGELIGETSSAIDRDARCGACPRRARLDGVAAAAREDAMTLGTILIILVIIYLLGGMSGRIGGYGYGMGHSGIGIGGLVLVVLIVLLLLGKL